LRAAATERSPFPPWPAGLSGGERLLLAALVAAHLLALWSVRTFPSQDGPIHLEMAAMLRELATGSASIVHHYFELNPQPVAQPNWLIYPPLALLSAVLSPRLAETLLLTAYILLFPAALLFLLRRVRQEGAYLVFLGLPVLFCYPLHMGFYNFCLGMTAALAAVAYWLPKRQLTPRSTLAFAALLLVAYFSHPVAWTMVGVAAGGVLVGDLIAPPPGVGRRGVLLHRALPTLVAALPELVSVARFASQEQGEPVQRLPLLALVKHLALGYSLVSYSRWELVFSVAQMATLTAAVAAVAWRRRRRLAWSPADGFLLAAGLVLALYFVLPVGLLGGGYLNQRLQLFVLLFVVAWLAGQPELDRWRRPVIAAGTVVTLGLLALHAASYRRLDGDLDEYLSAAPYVASGTTLLSLSYANFGPRDERGKTPSWKVRPFVHASGRLAAARGIVDLDDYQAGRDYFPVRYRPTCDPFVGDFDVSPESEPPRFDVAGYRRRPGCEIDYVLTWGATAADLPAIADTLDGAYEEVYVSPERGLTRLYRRRGTLPAPPAAAAEDAP
jgi:hypothetical protein